MRVCVCVCVHACVCMDRIVQPSPSINNLTQAEYGNGSLSWLHMHACMYVYVRCMMLHEYEPVTKYYYVHEPMFTDKCVQNVHTFLRMVSI